MLKWIGKILGSGAADLPPGVPPEWAALLEKLVTPFDRLGGNKMRAGIAQDVFSYVLTGDPVSVLHEAGQGVEIGNYLQLLGFHYGSNSHNLPDVYATIGAVPAPVVLRWARLLEACLATQKGYCALPLPGGSHWAEVLMMASAGCSVVGWSSERPQARGLTTAFLEALLVEDGLDASSLLAASFATPVDVGHCTEQRLLLVTDLPGYADALQRHVEALRPLMLPAKAAQRLHVLKMLATAHAATLDALAPALCELATTSSKQVRAAAETLVRKGGEAMHAPLRALATDAKPDQRVHALRLLASLAQQAADAPLLEFTRDTARADKAPSVQALIEEWDTAGTTTAHAQQDCVYTLPVIDWSGAANLPDDAPLRALWAELNDSIAKSNKQSREHHERMKAQGHNFALTETPPYSDADARQLREYLASDTRRPPDRKNDRRATWQIVPQALQGMLQKHTLTPVAAFKVLLFFGLVSDNRGSLLHPAITAMDALHRKTGHPTLLELSLMLDDAGLEGVALLRNYCAGWGTPFASEWTDDAVWPFVAHHLDAVIQALTLNTFKDYSFSRTGLFRAVATLPSPPAAVVNAMFSLALGPGKTDRLPAQEALRSLPGKEARIVQALADGKGETRALAAQWLYRLRHEPAIPALEEAVRKEKHDLAKGAMLDTLQSMGRPVEKYLDRDALAAEAAKALAKGMPKDIEWFPWAAMPPVRWADHLQPVPPEVLRWMLVQAVKQKLPEPNAVLRKYCAMFEPRDRERFGQFVLETWLQEDVRPIDPDTAMRQAQANAQSTFQAVQQYPQYYPQELGKSVQELLALYLPRMLRQPAGSATASKGLLAVVAACAAEGAVPPAQRYLKEWYGSRAAQGKALIAMLAWIEHPSATQLMLSIGSRFRTKSFQEEATRQAEALAERKGWTLAELADRTMPSAGFDETGTLELSFGARSFTARLLPDFKVELFNPDGKKIAALPEPRQDDDAEQAREAKKAFGSARKELKSIVALQTDRLYEALCTERDWPYADWHAYLHQHPVLRHLVQRLVWVQVADGRVLQVFRPLDDGTLTDRDDNALELPGDARVRLAHDSLLARAEVEAWQQHLLDYEVRPLFQQLGKGTYALPATLAAKDEILDFEGHLIEAFALRGRALKLGYTRGPAEDGGWFHVYEKRFPTLGLEAVIQFTGNPLPEENRTVALMNLSFSASGGAQSWERGKLALGKVPKVLLSECYNDLRLIASEGTGFDADWQKKSEY
jgi:hypothetical protein